MELENRKPLTYALLISFLLVVSFLVIQKRPVRQNIAARKYSQKIDDPYNKTIIIGENEIKVDIVDSPEETSQGLSGRDSMCENCGMYFDLGYTDTIPTFWMKDMNFPIDIIWIDDGEVVDITKEVPPPEPGTTEGELLRYRPNQTIDNVLELNSGYSDILNLKVGDKVILPEE